MPENLLTDPHVVVTTVVVIGGIVVRSWFSLRKLDTRERFRTSRFEKALEDSSPQQRPEIIRALNTLEDRSDTEPGDTGSDTGSHTEVPHITPNERPTFAGLPRLWRNPPPAKDQ